MSQGKPGEAKSLSLSSKQQKALEEGLKKGLLLALYEKKVLSDSQLNQLLGRKW